MLFFEPLTLFRGGLEGAHANDPILQGVTEPVSELKTTEAVAGADIATTPAKRPRKPREQKVRENLRKQSLHLWMLSFCM